jgi:glycosyltransferase involved in cell wall biosynthesis
MNKKIKMLVIPSDRTGVGKFRSVDPHVYIAEHYGDEFDVDIVYDMPKGNLEDFLKQYDLIHIHKQLDKQCKIIDLIKFLGIPVIIDIDDHFKLGDDHPMSLTAKKDRWHEPIINHLKKADYVTTTTPIFANVLKKYNKNVAVFPNAINPEEKQYTVPKTPPGDKLRVGIICGSSHLKDLQLLDGIAKQINKDKVQFILCGFDTRGNRTIYNQSTGEKTVRPILPQESVWCDYEKIFTDNYNNVSPEHKEFLMKYMPNVDDPFINEPYRRMWTRDINNYATHYANVDVLIAPLKENEFNGVKSELKEIECGFTHTAFIAQNFGAYTINLIPMIEKGGKINENGTALLVDPRKNHKDWAKYINKLADDREMLKKLQDNLYEFVKDRYSLDTVCKDRVKLYKKLVGVE